MNVIILTSLLVLVESLQLWLIINHWVRINPLLSFLLFVVCALAVIAVIAFLQQRKPQAIEGRKLYVIVQLLLLALLLAAAYKLVIYDFQPILAGRAFNLLAGIIVVSKLFWKRISKFLVALDGLLMDPANTPALRTMLEIGFVVFIPLFIYVPDAKAVIARLFLGDQFHHWDLFMAPAWSFLKGGKAYVDVISQYGVGIPMVMGAGSRMFGDFSYEHVFMLLNTLCIIYFLAVYVFLRCWLKSVGLAIIALLVGLKIQMFHTGASPFVFSYPSATVLRNYFDIFFFLCIWGHIRYERPWLLWASAVLCICAEFNLIDTGVYLIGAYYTYLLLICTRKNWLQMVGFALVVPAGVFILYYGVSGGHVLTKAYWLNMTEYIVYYLGGPGTIPYSESIHYHYFWASFMGFLMPLVYLATILIVGLLSYWNKERKTYALLIVVCIYGLGVYHYYVARTAITSYYVTGLPFVFVLCFWLQQWLKRVNAKTAVSTLLYLALFCGYCLWTNHQVLAYPNIFNFSRNPMVDPLVTLPIPDQRGYFNNMYIKYGEDYKLPLNSLGEKDEWLVNERDFKSDEQLKAFYESEFNFKQDADLVASLTKPDAKAAVFSSFDVKILMQADRKPFFYFCPFFMSHPMRMRIFPWENAYGHTYLSRTISQLDTEKPEFVFMERMFLSDQIPPVYEDDLPNLMAILRYIREHYKPSLYGRYLVAMKRI